MGRKATHKCPRGHVKNSENSYVDAKGHRRCRACTLARNKAWAAGQGGTGQGGRQGHPKTGPGRGQKGLAGARFGPAG